MKSKLLIPTILLSAFAPVADASTVIAFDDIFDSLPPAGFLGLRSFEFNYYSSQGITFDKLYLLFDGGTGNQAEELKGSNGDAYLVVNDASFSFFWGLTFASTISGIQFDIGLSASKTADFTTTAYLQGLQVAQQTFNHGDTDPIGGSWRTVSFSGVDFDSVDVVATNGTGAVIPGLPIVIPFNGYGIDNIQVVPEPSISLLSVFAIFAIVCRRKK